jgi:hypothetical protein
MPLPNLDNVGLPTTMNGWSSTDWSNFSSGLSTGWLAAWSSRFNLTLRQSTALALVPTSLQSLFSSAASYASSMLSSGYLIDASGEAFDMNPTGPAAAALPIKISVEPCIQYDPKNGIIFNIKIVITIGF